MVCYRIIFASQYIITCKNKKLILAQKCMRIKYRCTHECVSHENIVKLDILHIVFINLSYKITKNKNKIITKNKQRTTSVFVILN